MNCPLCNTVGRCFYEDDYLICDNCLSIFLNPQRYLSLEEEKSRYEEHNNDVNDVRYQKFVMPIVDYVVNNFTPQQKGLDFGSGTGPVISKLLKDKGYPIDQYDPFFAGDTSTLNSRYDYIVCCEVVEHFHHPNQEFKRLREMLIPEGDLICMTLLYRPEIDFKNWFYKSDPTHVFIYQKQTIEYIAADYNFRIIKLQDRLFVLRKGEG